MIVPAQKDDILLADIRRGDGRLRMWWLGQSGFLVQCSGQHLLLDPYLSDSLTEKYAATDKPHVRMTELAIDPARLDFIDVVTSSHNHTDHLDAATLGTLMRANPGLQLVVPEANREFVCDRLGCDSRWPIGLSDGQSAAVGQWEFHAIPASHERVERDERGRSKYLGYIVRFGRWTLYHAGDTLLYAELPGLLRSYAVDIALLPINGRAPERRVAGNLNAKEAVWLGKEIRAKLVIPMHYDMFAFNTADPAEFAEEAEREGVPYRVLQCGERWESNK